VSRQLNRYGVLAWRASTDIVKRWNLQADRPDVLAVKRPLETGWRSWSPDQRARLLEAVEAVASAERTRRGRTRRADQQDRRRLEAEAIAAAELAHDLDVRCPQPPTPLAVLVERLVAFAIAALQATADDRLAAVLARQVVTSQEAGRKSEAGRVRSTLFTSLVGLAIGVSRFDPDALRRRYLRPRTTTRGSGQAKRRKSLFELLQTLEVFHRRLLAQRSGWGLAQLFYESSEGSESGLLSAVHNLLTPPDVPPSESATRRDSDVQAARDLREALTRTFQAIHVGDSSSDANAGDDRGEVAYVSSINRVVTKLFPNRSPDQRRELLSQIIFGKTKPRAAELLPHGSPDQGRERLAQIKRQIESGRMKPSTVAARIAAAKFNLPLRAVRGGPSRQPLPRRSAKSIPFSDRLEHGLEQKSRGSTRSRAHTEDEENLTGGYDGRYTQSHRRRRPRRR
jgi:hypothetical protein